MRKRLLNLALSFPSLFKLFQKVCGINRVRTALIKEHMGVIENKRILDIGCGLGDILDHFPKVDYIGFDQDQRYIDFAKKYYGDRGAFFCEEISQKTTTIAPSSFDVVIAGGVLHHLNEEQALELAYLAKLALKPGGKFVTHDGCYTDDQSKLSRYILSKDRGQYVRTEKEYLKIISKVFSDIKTSVRHDLYRIPYPVLLMEAVK